MTILAQIEKDLQTALRGKNLPKISILRLLLARIYNAQIEKGKDNVLTDEEVLSEISKEVKRHKESIESFEAGRRADLAEKERLELEILQNFLPEQLAEAEIEKIVSLVISQIGTASPSDFGKVMGVVMPKVVGRADGKLVADVVRTKLKV